MYEIIVGRSEKEKEALKTKATAFIGKHYVKMGATTSLSNNIHIDVSRSHVILVCGKRGSGKSYSLSVLAEEIANIETELKDKIAVLIFDTMGIFWTMKYPNEKDEELLQQWNLEKKGLSVEVFAPQGSYEELKNKGIPVDSSFAINPQELTAEEWCHVFEISPMDPVGILIERTLAKLEGTNYSLETISKTIYEDTKIDENTRLAAENKFRSVQSWGLFSTEATPIDKIITGGKVSILDISMYKSWNVKCLVTGLISKKLMETRMSQRKEEEIEDIERGHSYFSEYTTELKKPNVWLFLDEAHEMLPKRGKTPATDALVQILREGRQPGISLVLATQQPGEIHKDVITQSDIVIAHRLTAKKDIEALSAMMQTYLTTDIQTLLNQLPRETGAALLLDDTSERLFTLRTRPKMSWHGGEAPVLIKLKGTAAEQLKL